MRKLFFITVWIDRARSIPYNWPIIIIEDLGIERVYHTTTMGIKIMYSLLLCLVSWVPISAFAPKPSNILSRVAVSPQQGTTWSSLNMAEGVSEATRERIQSLVDNNPVMLFMKGSKLFPQCGFSNTAVQILNSYGISFETFDVLSDDSIRQGVKDFSQWPTIPQLYVAGEFIGGSDIMIEMYQSGELGELIEKAVADM